VNIGSVSDYLGEYPLMKKNHLIISGSVLLIVGPSLGFFLNVYALHGTFNRLAESGITASPQALSDSIGICLVWTIAGIVIGITGLVALIFGLIPKKTAK